MQGSLCLTFFAGMPVPSQAALVVPCMGEGDSLRGSAMLTYANGAHFTQRRNRERQTPVVGRVVVAVCVLDPGRILGVWPGLRCLGLAARNGGGPHMYGSNPHKLCSWMTQSDLGFSTS